MKLIATVITFLLLGLPPLHADCSSIEREAAVRQRGLVAAKDEFKRDFASELDRRWTPASLDGAITSTLRVKAAVDSAIEVLLRAQAENCFGRDAENWASAIVQMKRESANLDASVQDYRKMKETIRRNGR